VIAHGGQDRGVEPRRGHVRLLHPVAGVQVGELPQVVNQPPFDELAAADHRAGQVLPVHKQHRAPVTAHVSSIRRLRLSFAAGSATVSAVTRIPPVVSG
jgi:hypothetical protein